MQESQEEQYKALLSVTDEFSSTKSNRPISQKKSAWFLLAPHFMCRHATRRKAGSFILHPKKPLLISLHSCSQYFCPRIYIQNCTCDRGQFLIMLSLKRSSGHQKRRCDRQQHLRERHAIPCSISLVAIPPKPSISNVASGWSAT